MPKVATTILSIKVHDQSHKVTEGAALIEYACQKSNLYLAWFKSYN